MVMLRRVKMQSTVTRVNRCMKMRTIRAVTRTVSGVLARTAPSSRLRSQHSAPKDPTSCIP